MRKFRSDWGEVRNPNASRRYKPLLRSFDQLQQAEPLRKVKSTTSRGLPLHLCPVRCRTPAAIQMDSKLLPNSRRSAFEGREWYAHRAVPGFPRRIDTSGQRKSRVPNPTIFVVGGCQVDVGIDPLSLCGEISNSLYPRMFWKSAPINPSATSQSQSRNVSVEILGDGLRFSLPLRTDDKKYRFFFVHRDRTSVRWLTRFRLAALFQQRQVGLPAKMRCRIRGRCDVLPSFCAFDQTIFGGPGQLDADDNQHTKHDGVTQTVSA